MQAVWLTRFGGPDVLVARETPDPAPAQGQVVVDVEAASITFVETLVRAGRPPWPGAAPQPPYVLGNGVGGIVSAVGEGVDAAWIGRRVVTGTGGTGGYASRVAVAASGLVAVPDVLDIQDATALLADGRTAVGLFELAAPMEDEWVLVEAAAGGVGSLLVQLASAAGARVIAAAGGERKLDVARSLGASVGVDYDQPGWDADVREATGGIDIVFDAVEVVFEGIHVVFDSVGGAIGQTALELIAPDGRFVTFGLAGGSATDTSLAPPSVRIIGIRELGALGARSAELTSIALDLAAAGTLRPVIGQTFPLAAAAEAHAAIESRATIGKTLLIC